MLHYKIRVFMPLIICLYFVEGCSVYSTYPIVIKPKLQDTVKKIHFNMDILPGGLTLGSSYFINKNWYADFNMMGKISYAPQEFKTEFQDIRNYGGGLGVNTSLGYFIPIQSNQAVNILCSYQKMFNGKSVNRMEHLFGPGVGYMISTNKKLQIGAYYGLLYTLRRSVYYKVEEDYLVAYRRYDNGKLINQYTIEIGSENFKCFLSGSFKTLVHSKIETPPLQVGMTIKLFSE